MTTSKANKPAGDKKPAPKILDRIRKLLAMASDVNSPNEAAIAARRAERLMAEYNLEHADMVTAGLDEDSIDRQNHGPAYKSYPLHLSRLAVGVAEYTGCHAVFARQSGTIKRQIAFYGERSDLEICKYLWTYLATTIDRLCAASGVKYIGPRTAFKKGCVSEIVKTLKKMREQDDASDAVASSGKSVVLVDKKQSLIAKKYGVAKYRRSTTKLSAGSGDAYQAGCEAGRGVSIRKAVNSSAGVRRLQ